MGLSLVLVIAIGTLITNSCDAANILVFLPFYGTSHNLVTMPYVEELARRGHNVTSVGYFEPRNPSPNLRVLLLKEAPGRTLRGFLSTEDYVNSDHMTTMDLIHKDILDRSDESIVRNKKQLDEMLIGNYDLVVVELFESDLFVGFASKFDSPFILFHTCEPFPWHRDTLGDPISPALIPQVFSKYAAPMEFLERFWNTFEIVQMMWYYRTVMLPTAQRVAEKHLGRLPPVDELTKRASLYFTNTHYSIFGPRPMNPSTIEIGGINVFTPNPLPQVLVLSNTNYNWQALLNSRQSPFHYNVSKIRTYVTKLPSSVFNQWMSTVTWLG